MSNKKIILKMQSFGHETFLFTHVHQVQHTYAKLKGLFSLFYSISINYPFFNGVCRLNLQERSHFNETIFFRFISTCYWHEGEVSVLERPELSVQAQLRP